MLYDELMGRHDSKLLHDSVRSIDFSEVLVSPSIDVFFFLIWVDVGGRLERGLFEDFSWA